MPSRYVRQVVGAGSAQGTAVADFTYLPPPVLVAQSSMATMVSSRMQALPQGIASDAAFLASRPVSKAVPMCRGALYGITRMTLSLRWSGAPIRALPGRRSSSFLVTASAELVTQKSGFVPSRPTKLSQLLLFEKYSSDLHVEKAINAFNKGALGATALVGENSEDLQQSEGDSFFVHCDGIAHTPEGVLTSAVDMIDFDEELLDEQDRITGALQIGVVGCRRSASWICFGGGARPRRKRAWKTVNRRGSVAKARKLVNTISELPSDKEEIYGALDAFVAWELEFPIIAIKKALQSMAEDQQWKRVIQVTKWMLSKGQGKTMGTYTLLLQAFDYEGRVEEADALWEKLLTQHEDATPRIMFTVVLAMFERHKQSRRLLQVFADMEELEIRPDIVTVERVARTYRSLGLLKRAEAVEVKYPRTTWAYRYSKRGKTLKKYRVRVTAEGEVLKPENPIKSEADAKAAAEEEDVDDSDSDDNDEYIYEEESEGEESEGAESYLRNSDNVVQSIGH